jgi:nucleotide-binding universal stress UspA family protein
MDKNAKVVKGQVLALLEGGTQDQLVVERALQIAESIHAPLTLVRVAPLVEISQPRSPQASGLMEPWQVMRDQERVLRAALQAVAPASARVEIRFGDPIDQLTSVAGQFRPSSVVAARGGRGRDRRLADAFGARLELVGTAPAPLGRRVVAQLERLGNRPDRQKINALREVSIFSHLPRKEVESIARQLDPAMVQPGTVLIREGQRNGTFWIIRQGEVEVTLRGRLLRRIGPHGFFGAISMLDGREASSTVVATTPVAAYVASAVQFRDLKGNELVALRLQADAEERLRETQLQLARELAAAR